MTSGRFVSVGGLSPSSLALAPVRTGERPPARAAQQGRAEQTRGVGRPGRALGGRPAQPARAARFLEPAVRPRAGAGVRPVRPPRRRGSRLRRRLRRRGCSRDFGISGPAGTVAASHRRRGRSRDSGWGSGGAGAGGRGGGAGGASTGGGGTGGASTGGSSGTSGGGRGRYRRQERRGSEQRLWHEQWREDADHRRLVGHERSSHVDQTQHHERRNESRIHHRHSGGLRSDAPVSPDLFLVPGVWFGHRQCEWPTSRQ